MAQKLSASSRLALPSATKPDDMIEPKWVTYELDLLNRPPLTPEQIADLEHLKYIRDEDIDFSDIPPLTDDFFKNAKQGVMYRALKEQLTIRLDADVLDWFKRHAKDGKGYQTDINKALRAYVVAQERKAARKAG